MRSLIIWLVIAAFALPSTLVWGDGERTTQGDIEGITSWARKTLISTSSDGTPVGEEKREALRLLILEAFDDDLKSYDLDDLEGTLQYPERNGLWNEFAHKFINRAKDLGYRNYQERIETLDDLPLVTKNWERYGGRINVDCEPFLQFEENGSVEDKSEETIPSDLTSVDPPPIAESYQTRDDTSPYSIAASDPPYSSFWSYYDRKFPLPDFWERVPPEKRNRIKDTELEIEYGFKREFIRRLIEIVGLLQVIDLKEDKIQFLRSSTQCFSDVLNYPEIQEGIEKAEEVIKESADELDVLRYNRVKEMKRAWKLHLQLQRDLLILEEPYFPSDISYGNIRQFNRVTLRKMFERLYAFSPEGIKHPGPPTPSQLRAFRDSIFSSTMIPKERPSAYEDNFYFNFWIENHEKRSLKEAGIFNESVFDLLFVNDDSDSDIDLPYWVGDLTIKGLDNFSERAQEERRELLKKLIKGIDDALVLSHPLLKHSGYGEYPRYGSHEFDKLSDDPATEPTKDDFKRFQGASQEALENQVDGVKELCGQFDNPKEVDVRKMGEQIVRNLVADKQGLPRNLSPAFCRLKDRVFSAELDQFLIDQGVNIALIAATGFLTAGTTTPAALAWLGRFAASGLNATVGTIYAYQACMDYLHQIKETQDGIDRSTNPGEADSSSCLLSVALTVALDGYFNGKRGVAVKKLFKGWRKVDPVPGETTIPNLIDGVPEGRLADFDFKNVLSNRHMMSTWVAEKDGEKLVVKVMDDVPPEGSVTQSADETQSPTSIVFSEKDGIEIDFSATESPSPTSPIRTSPNGGNNPPPISAHKTTDDVVNAMYATNAISMILDHLHIPNQGFRLFKDKVSGKLFLVGKFIEGKPLDKLDQKKLKIIRRLVQKHPRLINGWSDNAVAIVTTGLGDINPTNLVWANMRSGSDRLIIIDPGELAFSFRDVGRVLKDYRTARRGQRKLVDHETKWRTRQIFHDRYFLGLGMKPPTGGVSRLTHAGVKAINEDPTILMYATSSPNPSKHAKNMAEAKRRFLEMEKHLNSLSDPYPHGWRGVTDFFQYTSEAFPRISDDILMSPFYRSNPEMYLLQTENGLLKIAQTEDGDFASFLIDDDNDPSTPDAIAIVPLSEDFNAFEDGVLGPTDSSTNSEDQQFDPQELIVRLQRTSDKIDALKPNQTSEIKDIIKDIDGIVSDIVRVRGDGDDEADREFWRPLLIEALDQRQDAKEMLMSISSF
ncbi:MAG TPA: hypothetical protein VJL87_01380 [Bdellovibrionota bacterium]|nr:hypothetical protein [Bdellovibrionota bacterium]